MTTRTCTYQRKITCKDGTVNVHTYTASYVAKTNVRFIGKEDIRKRITKCTDKEKIDLLRIYMDEIGM
jgi:hypothetical protein